MISSVHDPVVESKNVNFLRAAMGLFNTLASEFSSSMIDGRKDFVNICEMTGESPYFPWRSMVSALTELRLVLCIKLGDAAILQTLPKSEPWRWAAICNVFPALSFFIDEAH